MVAVHSPLQADDSFSQIEVEALRREFPILHQQVHGSPLVYLDNAATTQKPRAVLEALVRYYEKDNSNVHRGIHELSARATQAYEAARVRVASFIGAREAAEIVFTRGTTEGINLVASSWSSAFLRPGDKILLTEMEHHSNIVPWQLAAARAGAKLVYLPVTGDEGELDLDRLDALLADGVKLFAFAHVSNTLGTVNPAAFLCSRARHFGVTTLVDAAQSAGHFPLNVQGMGCDFLAFSAHKMCGPTGFGALYGPQGTARPDATVPRGRRHDLAGRFLREGSWNVVPHKFEAGTPDISGAVGLRAALDFLEQTGRSRVARYDHALAQYAYDELERVGGFRLFGPKKGRAGVVSFLMNGVHAHDVVTVADQYGVALRGGHHCTQPLMKKLGVESTARASFYFYNTREEVTAWSKSWARSGNFSNHKPRRKKMIATEKEITPASTMSEVLGGLAQRPAGVVSPLPHRRLQQLRLPAGGDRAGPLRAQQQPGFRRSPRPNQDQPRAGRQTPNLPADLATLVRADPAVKLVDIRSRPEWETTKLPGALLLNQELMQEMMAKWPKDCPVVVYDHSGGQGLDAVAYFSGHGMTNIRCLRGGIDAWALEADPSVPRYQVNRKAK